MRGLRSPTTQLVFRGSLDVDGTRLSTPGGASGLLAQFEPSDVLAERVANRHGREGQETIGASAR
jgi:hypothetical protein